MLNFLRKSPLFVLMLFALAPSISFAVPSFARQTGMDCAACHTSFPELTPFGREFKLNGYTLGERQLLPLAAMMQFSMTNLAKNHDSSGVKIMSRENDLQFDVLGLFLAGKLNDHAGMFIQWTYNNNGTQNAEGKIVGHSALDNTDIRFVLNHDIFGKNTVFGLSLNNNPSVQDAWNTTPAWGFPFNGPNLPNVPGPSFTSSIIEGGLSQQVAGVGGYFWYDRHLYGELSFYGNANKTFRVLSAGQDWNGGVTRIDGRNNPYWRLAWNEDWGAHSLMVGTYGMQVDRFPDPLNPYGSTDRFTDTAFDAQYQFLSDPHIMTLQTTFIHEKQDNRTSYDPTCISGPCNPSNHLNTFKAKASYLYNRKYGASLAYFNTTGSNDAFAFSTGNNTITKPDTQSYVLQLDYNPWTFARVSLQYTGYIKFDGSRDVDLVGLKPSDRNTLFLNTWFAF
ncbi:MAG: hypothetical protein WA123_04645 [Methylotenera sp.]